MEGTLYTVVSSSFEDVIDGLVTFLPNLITAFLLIVIGWIIGSLVAKGIIHLVQMMKLDNFLKEAGVNRVVEKTGFLLKPGVFLGELVKWFFIIVFLIAALNVVGLSQVNLLLSQIVIGYIPRVISAVLILLISVVIAEILDKLISGSGESAHLKSAKFFGTVTKWAILGGALFAALIELGIGVTFVQTILTGAVFAAALAIGLSFGIGGRNEAKRALEKLRIKLTGEEVAEEVIPEGHRLEELNEEYKDAFNGKI